jgi:cytochrome c-type biogenesis protein CcmH/NrfG
MEQRKKIQFGSAVVLGFALILLILLRDSPFLSGTGTVTADSTVAQPPVMDVPSKTNVAPAFTQQVEQLKRSAEAQPKNAEHMIALARLLMDGHQNAEATVWFERALHLQPKNDSLLLDLAVCYFNQGNFIKAMDRTEQILAFDRHHARALYNKGSILATQKKNQQAVAVWKLLIKHHPESEEAVTVRKYIAQLEKE